MAAAANRKRIGITAPPGAWKHLGELLEAWRRIELGYKARTGFAADRLPKTPAGNANIRLVSDIENNYRPDTYPAGTLREIAGYYGVTYESLLAVLRGEAGTLARAAVPVPPSPVTQLPPMPDADRIAADKPYADAIHRQLRALATSGIGEPSGAQVFPASPADAQAWDGIGARMEEDDRVWFIADLQRRAGDRDPGTRAGNSAG